MRKKPPAVAKLANGDCGALKGERSYVQKKQKDLSGVKTVYLS
jgi:hypothetical protein